MAAGTRLVGRDTELARLGDAVARARDGTRTTVVLEGAAGLGKSRLLTETLTRFRDPKDAVAIGYGLELGGGELPYGTATEILRTLVRSAGVNAVHDAAGEYRPQLASLCPSLANGGVPDGEVNRAGLLPAAAATLENLATDRLVWLVVEDLHWVDPHSLDLLTYVTRLATDAQLLTILTTRVPDASVNAGAADLTHSLCSRPGTDLVALAPLGEDAMAALVADLTGETATEAQVGRVVSLADGSPLLAEQLAGAGLDDGGLLPDTIAGPLLARYRRLDPQAAWVVQVGSLAEGHLTHRLLRPAGTTEDSDGGSVDDAIDRAVEAGLLRYDPNDQSLTFTHALLRQAVEGTLSPSQRVRIHRRWAQLLGDPHNHGEEPLLLVAAAQHWAATDSDSDTFTSAIAAARLSARLGAVDLTADLLTRAWHLWDRVSDPSQSGGPTREDLLLDTLNALETASRYAEAIAVVERELARENGKRDQLRHLCLRLCQDEFRVALGETPDEGLQRRLVQAADELLAAPPSRLVLTSLALLGWRLRWHDPAASLLLQQHALTMARPFGGGELAYVASSVAENLGERGLTDEAAAICEEAAAEATTITDRLLSEKILVWVLYHGARFAEAAARTDRVLAQLPDPQLAADDWTFTAMLGGHSHLALGNWDLMAERFSRCASLELSDWATKVLLTTDIARLECARGDLQPAQERAEWGYAQLPANPPVEMLIVVQGTLEAVAEVAAGRADYAAALEALAPVLRNPGMETYCNLWSPTLASARYAADHVAAGGTVSRETTQAITTAVDTLPTTGPFNFARHLQGRADLARAEHSDTPDMWRDVVDVWRMLGHVPNTGWSSFRLAGSLVAADDKPAAREPLLEAWEIAQRLGAKPLRDAAIDLARRAHLPLGADGADPGAPVSGPLARLTARELEVLRHLASGESNDEIAAALFISPKTASVHVSRILAKLDVSSRSRAAAIAYEHGLLATR